MMSGDQTARLEMLLGDCCPLPALGTGGVIEVAVTESVFAKLAAYWLDLPAGSRPKLRGLTVSRPGNAPKQIRLVVDIGGKSPLILFSADCSSGNPLPRLSGVWPYAAWWEEEIRFFENTEMQPGKVEGGVTWRRD